MEGTSKISHSKKLIFIFFFSFPRKFLTAIFFVIGLKQGKSPAMGEKKEAMMLEFGKSREDGVSSHFTHVKQLHIVQSKDIQTRFR